MHKDTIFCGATSTLLLSRTLMLLDSIVIQKFFFVRRGFQNFVLIIQFHVWEFIPQLNCSCLDIFLHCMHDLIDMSVMYTYIFMLEKNENWEEERIFTQRFIKLPSPPVNCIEGKNLIIIVMKNVRKLKNLFSLLLRIF